MEKPRRAVVVTGFGPFGEHAVNASWIAVQENKAQELHERAALGSAHRIRTCNEGRQPEDKLDNEYNPPNSTSPYMCLVLSELEKLGLRDDVDLHVYEVPVEYQTVQRLIPALWKKHSPQLVVHVGVSGMATTVTLEKCGHNVGYKGLDNCRFCPGSQCCVEGGPECIDSIIDMDTVCKRVSALGLDVTVTISKDAGRYLCDFTYYTSLYQSRGRSAFVHVPPLGKPYSAEQLGRALQAIIEEMLDVLEHSEDKINCQHEH